ncbi:MAG: SIS domain-containing protein [Candidatus Bathyarchaeia archaeon]
MFPREIKQEYSMIKDIRDSPNALKAVIKSLNRMSEIADYACKFRKIFFIGCGSSYYAALFGSWPLMRNGELVAYALPSSELIFHFANIVNSDSLVIGISRSGRTAETVTALEICKRRGARTVGFTIEKESEITGIVNEPIVLDIGEEKSIIMTKSFTAFSLATAVFSSILDEKISGEKHIFVDESKAMPSLTENILKAEGRIAAVSKRLLDESIERFIFLGSGPSYPIALEGALKVKETSYVATEGLHLLEFRHGPMATIGERLTLVISCFLGENAIYLKNFVSEFASKSADMVLISDSEDFGENALRLPPEYSGECKALLSIVPMQILAHYYAVGKGRDPDKPRNLFRYVQRF